ncbi:MAG: ABC transporter permease [Bryobacteraceae bacterium]|nr:ABC transporter permease [Bryobacteraceae bacterium]
MSCARDLRYAVRQLRRSPGFTAVAVLSLALGIGANSAIFQLIDAVRLRSLPVHNPQELAIIDLADGAERSGWFSTPSARLTYGHWEQIRARQEAFSEVAAWSLARFNLTSGGEARYAQGLFVSGNFFRTLGITPFQGRLFTAEDDSQACNAGAVLGYAFWQREFGGSPAALGRTVTLNGYVFPVIGVTPPQFLGVEVGSRYDVAVPLCADRLIDKEKKGRMSLAHAWWLSMIGRRNPGWSVERASAHLASLSPGIMQATLPPVYRPDSAKLYLANKLTAAPGGAGVSGLRRDYERPLWLLMATTGLVLLIACANLANLLLARASVRQREVATRFAMGASRGRLIRQLMAEGLLLASAGAALGMALAQALSRGLVAFLSTANEPILISIELDWRALAFTGGLAIATTLLFGLLPALRATRLSPAGVMRAGGRGATAGRERFALRRSLVTGQIALSFVLLVGALLFARSLANLMTTHPGFQAEGALAVNLDLRRAEYSKDRLPAVFRDVQERLAALPGVTSAAQAAIVPVSGSGWNGKVGVDGAPAEGSASISNFNRVAPGYFRAMGTRLIAGRDFDDGDRLSSPAVAIVNQEFARRFFGGANPVGRTFRRQADAGEPEPVIQVVGLVENTKYYQLREDFFPIAYLSMAQEGDPEADASYVLRMAGNVGGVMRNVKNAIGEVNPAIGIEFRLMSRQLEDSLMRERLMAALSGAFGLLAALLATLGLYGVIAYMVARRRSEIGVRMALGAGRGRVIRLVLGEAGLLVVIGLAAGAVLALAAGRAAAALLFGLEPHDPLTMAAAMALLALVAFASAYGPARRAAALEPMSALREE